MSYRVHVEITEKETGVKHGYQLFGNYDLPTTFAEWLKEQGVQFGDDDVFGVRHEEPCEENGYDGFIIEAIEVDPGELLEQVCKVSEDEYLRLRADDKDPFAMNYAYPGYEPPQSESFGQAMLDLISFTYPFNWLDFLNWGRQYGLYSQSGIYPVGCVSGWENRLIVGVYGY